MWMSLEWVLLSHDLEVVILKSFETSSHCHFVSFEMEGEITAHVACDGLNGEGRKSQRQLASLVSCNIE